MSERNLLQYTLRLLRMPAYVCIHDMFDDVRSDKSCVENAVYVEVTRYSYERMLLTDSENL
jgi:hypothetical protein